MTDGRREWDLPFLPTADELAMDPERRSLSVVRVFPDGAENTVLWFAEDFVTYDEARISEPLAAAMEAWEEHYEAQIGPHRLFRSQSAHDHHYAEGLRLARELSDELGDELEVEVFVSDDGGRVVRRRMIGLGAGTNPEAVAAFRRTAAHGDAPRPEA